MTSSKVMADLDAVGNTTKAITKGVAIASAVIAAVSLFASFLTDVGLVQQQLGQKVREAICISDTRVFIDFLLGGAHPGQIQPNRHSRLGFRNAAGTGSSLGNLEEQEADPGAMIGGRRRE